MITLALFTNQPILAAGVRALIAQADGIELLTTAESLEVAAFPPMQPDPAVVIVDLPPGANMETIRLAAKRFPRAAILLLSRTVSPEISYQAREFGAAAALQTDASPGMFVTVLRRIAAGEFVFDMPPESDPRALRRFHLSPREGQLVVLLSQGLKNKEIAEVLGITEGTVKVYLSKLYEKVGAKDRFELALFGLKNYGQGRLDFSREPLGSEAHPAARQVVTSLKSLVASAPKGRQELSRLAKAVGL